MSFDTVTWIKKLDQFVLTMLSVLVSVYRTLWLIHTYSTFYVCLFGSPLATVLKQLYFPRCPLILSLNISTHQYTFILTKRLTVHITTTKTLNKDQLKVCLIHIIALGNSISLLIGDRFLWTVDPWTFSCAYCNIPKLDHCLLNVDRTLFPFFICLKNKTKQKNSYTEYSTMNLLPRY